MGRRAFFMIAFAASGIAAGALFMGSCANKKVPELQTIKEPQAIKESQVMKVAPASPPASSATLPASGRLDKNQKTILEKLDQRKNCSSTPGSCDVDFFELDIKKELQTEIDPGLSSTLCAGGCSDKSAFKWSLHW